MPAPETSSRRWTPDEFYAARDRVPASTRYELVDGELLVTASPVRRHQRIAFRLALLLDAYARAEPLGEVLMAPFDVKLAPTTILQPDLLLIPPDDPSEKEVAFVSLAIEVISPSSARHDRVTKRRRYQRSGVPEYWVVDDAAQTIERWHPDEERPEVVVDELRWQPPGATEPFVLDVPAFFRGVA